jgi:hypothetical protein
MLSLCLLVVLDPDRGFTFVVDDAYYYLQIARNTDQSGIVSFDGIHRTNGFHPLWLSMLVVLHRLSPAGDAAFVTLTQLSALILAVGAVAWLRHLLVPLAGPLARAAALLVLFNPWALSRFWLSGMESAAGILLVLAFLAGWRDLLGSRSTELLLRTCLAGGLACLCRFDLAILVVPALCFLARTWLRDRGSAGVKDTVWSLLAGAVAMGLPVAAWLAWNLAEHGTATTVSSYVKTALSPMTLSERYDNLCLVLPSLKFLVGIPVVRIVSPLVLAAVAWGALQLGRNIVPDAARSTYRLLAAAAAIHYVAARGGVAESYSWYYLLETLLAAHLAALAVGHLHRPHPAASPATVLLRPSCFAKASQDRSGCDGQVDHRPSTIFSSPRSAEATSTAAATMWTWTRRGAPVLVAAVVASCAWLTRDMLRDEPGYFVSRAIQREGRAAAEWLNANTPADSVVASWDAGVLGYFSHRPVINLDGLVNDWEFVEVIRTRRYVDYLEREGVDFVANSFFVLEDGTLWHQREGMAEVMPQLRPMYRGNGVPFLGVPVTVAVFRFEPGGLP